jgi:exodeoxyribonuclease V alpha subunit
LELWNGDVGVLGWNRDGTRLVGYFRKDGTLRAVPLSRLPTHETVFAMTVHKSQGSEFDRVGVVLPEQPSPLLTRELLYTAITRCKREVTLFGSAAVLNEGIKNGLRRTSGLAQRLG